LVFFFHATPPTDIYTLSLHDALPIYGMCAQNVSAPEQCIFPYEHVDGICLLDNAECSNGQTGISVVVDLATGATQCSAHTNSSRSEEHTSELQSRENLVCRLLLEKKK